MDLTQILTKLNDQMEGESIEIQGKLILTGSEVKPGNIMSFPNKFELIRRNEAAYELRQIGGEFRMGFVATDYWESVGEYIKTGILSITGAAPEGCALLVNHYKPTELRFEDIR